MNLNMPKPKTPARTYTPNDYLRGSKNIGGTYTAFDTYGQGTPDFGHALGPGDPYHEVQKKIQPMPKWAGSGSKALKWAPGINIGSTNPAQSTQPAAIGSSDPRIEAIRRRLRGL